MTLYFRFSNVWKGNFGSPSIIAILLPQLLNAFSQLKMKKEIIPELPFFHFPVCSDVVVAYNQEYLEIQAKTVEYSFFLEYLAVLSKLATTAAQPFCCSFCSKTRFSQFSAISTASEWKSWKLDKKIIQSDLP